MWNDKTKFLTLGIFLSFLFFSMVSAGSIANRTSVDNGQQVNITSTWSAGTAPYNAFIYFTPSYDSSCTYSGIPLSTKTGITGTTTSFIETPTQSGFYCVNVTDSNSISTTTATNTITFYQTPLINSGYLLYVKNPQSTSIPANTQILVNINLSKISGVNTNTYNNIELTYNGNVIDTWIQNYTVSSSNSIGMWTKLPVNLPGNSEALLNVIVSPSNTNLLNAQTTGEAPQLSVITTENPSVWDNLTFLTYKNGLRGVLGPILNGSQTVNGQEATVIYANDSQLLNVPSTTKVFKMWWRSTDGNIPGYPSSVNYAESLNGYNWTTVPGNTTLNCGLYGSSSPTYGNSVVICMQPFVMSYNGLYYLYINAQNKNTGYLTCLEDVYTSSNGISWNIAALNVTNVCSKPNWITSGVLGNRYVWRNNATGTWYQLQEADGNGGWQTGLFTSNSPTGKWTEYGTNAVIGPAYGAGNPEMVFGGPELHIINGTYYVWGQCNVGENHTDTGASTDICLAYTSNVLGNWTYSKYNPVFWRSTWWENATGSNSQVADPSIVSLPNDTTYMFYDAIPSQPVPNIGVARSNETLAQILTTGEMNQSASKKTVGYGKYDNGASVFNKYQNYAGTKLWGGLKTGLSALTSNGLYLSQDNGLTIGVNSSDTGYSILTNWSITSPFIYQSLITAENKGGAGNFQEGIIADAASDIDQEISGQTCGQNWYITRRSIPNNFYQLLTCSTVLAQSGALGSYPYTSMETFTQNTTGISVSDAGTTLANTIENTFQSGYVGYDLVFSLSINPDSMFVQYSRVRSYLPSSMMPLSITTQTIADGFTASSYNITQGQTQTLTATVVGGASPYTYNYSIYNSSGQLVNNKINTNISNTNSYSYIQNIAWGSGNFVAKVVITDSNGAKMSNSINYKFNVSPQPQNNNGGGGSSSTTLSISDNLDVQSTAPIITVALLNPSTKTVISKTSYTQSELPATITLSNEEAELNFVCSFNVGSSTYKYSNDTYGLGFGTICNKNYTVYGGSYTMIYSKVNTSSSVSTVSTTSTTPTTSTSSTTIPNITQINTSKTISLNTTNNIEIGSNNNTKLITTSKTISILLHNPQQSAVYAVVLIKNLTNSKLIPTLKNQTELSAFDINVSSTQNVSISVALKYSCNINSNSVAPYILQNNTWDAITPFSINSTSCAISFSIPSDPIVALFSNNSISTSTLTTTTIQSTTTSYSNNTSTIQTTSANASSNNTTYLVIIVIIIIAIALSAWYMLKKKH